MGGDYAELPHEWYQSVPRYMRMAPKFMQSPWMDSSERCAIESVHANAWCLCGDIIYRPQILQPTSAGSTRVQPLAIRTPDPGQLHSNIDSYSDGIYILTSTCLTLCLVNSNHSR